MSHEGYHEPYELLSAEVRDRHRAFASVMEELEAADWYYQRAEVTDDAALKAIMLHNAHEELEHAAMAIEWLRRHDPIFAAKLRTYLFRSDDIVAAEHAEEHDEAVGAKHDETSRAKPRTLGSLRNSGGRA